MILKSNEKGGDEAFKYSFSNSTQLHRIINSNAGNKI